MRATGWMTVSTALAAALAFSGTSAPAQTDPLAGYYGNTLIWSMTAPANLSGHTWFMPDHTFQQFMVNRADGTFRVFIGEWQIQGDKLCRIDRGRTPPVNSCDYPANTQELNRKVGDKWVANDRSGNPQSFELVAGHR